MTNFLCIYWNCIHYDLRLSYHVSYHLLSFHRSVQEYKIPYGYGNSHIFRNQQVKPSQKCTTITWSNTVFDVSAKYKFFSMIKCSKNNAVR